MIVIKKQPLLREYAKPLAEEIVMSPEGMLCTSPANGGLEDLGEEELQL